MFEWLLFALNIAQSQGDVESAIKQFYNGLITTAHVEESFLTIVW